MKIATIVDIYTPPAPTYEEIRSAEAGVQVIQARIAKYARGSATFALTKTVSKSRIRLLLAQWAVLSKHEFAFSGTYSDEELDGLTYDELYAILYASKKAARACYPCGYTAPTITSYFPTIAVQPDDTIKDVLDALRATANLGYQAGVIYEPGHEADTSPYPIADHNHRAIPTSTVNIDGARLALSDRAFRDAGLGASDFYACLQTIVDAGEDVCYQVDSSITGQPGVWLDEFKTFLIYAAGKGAVFVPAREL